MADRYCLLRITTVPMAARSRSSIAESSSWYAFSAPVTRRQPVGARSRSGQWLASSTKSVTSTAFVDSGFSSSKSSFLSKVT